MIKRNPKFVKANKMLTKEERLAKISPFLSIGWLKRKEAIKSRVAHKQGLAHRRAVLRRKNAEAVKSGVLQAHIDQRRASRYK